MRFPDRLIRRALVALTSIALLCVLPLAAQQRSTRDVSIKDSAVSQSLIGAPTGRLIPCVGNACGDPAVLRGAGLFGATNALTGRITASLVGSQSSTLDLGSAVFAPALSYAQAFTFGTGNDQIQIIYADSGTIAASDSLTHDLAGATADAFGATFTCATLKAEMVTAPSTNTNDVLLGGATVAQINTGSGAADTLAVTAVRPGGMELKVAPRTGFTVTAGSRDKNRLKNSAGTTGVKYLAVYFCR